ncbi:MAG: hypothetical protein IIX99_01705 [Oscillospiraceae bacterium]|nr:hypothetical protein [Oscillospiraceae bacterium]
MKHNKKAWAGLILSVFAYLLVHFWPVLLVLNIAWDPTVSLPSSFFPEGTKFETIDNIGGFPAVGAEKAIAHIPPEHAKNFEETLRESGYTSTPISYTVRSIDRYDDLKDLYPIENGLWCIYDDTPEGRTDKWENFTFCIYDLDTCTYYSVHVLT